MTTTDDESPRDILVDEIAEALRGRGCPAAAAPQFAETSLDVIATHRTESECGDGESLAELKTRIESVIREILRGVIAAKEPRLEARIQLIARGDDAGGESMRAVARDYSLSPEAISKRVAAARELFALPATQHNKTPDACATYARTNSRRVIPHYPPIPDHG